MTTLHTPTIQDTRQWVDIEQVKLNPALAHLLPASVARSVRVLPLCKIADELIVATSQSDLAHVRTNLAPLLKLPFQLVQVDETLLRKQLAKTYPRTQAGSVQDSETRFVQLCFELLSAAAQRAASDIHIVPGDAKTEISFRVDGVLETYLHLEHSQHAGVVNRFKVLAGLNIAEKREPQDGRFSIPRQAGQPKTDVRVATIPTRFGERITLRLLTPLTSPSLQDLGMSEADHLRFCSAIQQPNGLILLTGPTGSGKSTTLYTAIKEIQRSRGGNIITIEDPIEYEIEGVTQVEVDVHAKVTFSRALRSILRHDPDVIMLGEIRDAETADLAIKAALTGHLVLSTLHTNTAAGVVTRLMDLGVEPFLISATLRLAIAQRLVRVLCATCKKEVTLSHQEAEQLGDPGVAGNSAWSSLGCVYCSGQGYAGRTALFEMLGGGGQLAQLISADSTEQELLEFMGQVGCTSLLDDGRRRVVNGTTTVKQVLGSVAVW
jgi:type II secretory ATPase GspE/PulE/Tfp pilus assembly ATPase PilB-like protein